MKLLPFQTLQIVATLTLAMILAACGAEATDAPAGDAADEPAAAEPTEPPATPTEVPPTSTPAATPTPEPLVVVYEDPEGDCLDNNNVPAPCIPTGVDILSATISEESPLTIVLEVVSPGFEELRSGGIFGMTYGIDLDQDPTTGHTAFWPDFHVLGPDLELHWFEDGGEVVAQGVSHYAPDGTMTEGDASLATWTVLDETHLQVVISDELITSPSFGLAGDLFTPNVYDHFVDEGHVTYPDGEVVLGE